MKHTYMAPAATLTRKRQCTVTALDISAFDLLTVTAQQPFDLPGHKTPY